MRVLIIGGTSFIGRYFIKYTKIKKVFPTSSKNKKNFIKFNLLTDNVGFIIEKYKISHVIFLSAFSRPQDCEKNKKLSYEKVFRNDYKYDFFLPIKYNWNNVKLGAGSAIFIHLTKNYKPTAGCIGLSEKDFLILIKLINKNTKINIF